MGSCNWDTGILVQPSEDADVWLMPDVGEIAGR
jgi:hypothetical protein